MRLSLLLFFSSLLLMPLPGSGQDRGSCSQVEDAPFGPLTMDRYKTKTILEGGIEVSFGAKGSKIVSSILSFLLQSVDGALSGGQTLESEPVFVEMNLQFNRLSCVLYHQAIANYDLRMAEEGLTTRFKKWRKDEKIKQIAAEARVAYTNALYALLQDQYALPETLPSAPTGRTRGPHNFPQRSPSAHKGPAPAPSWIEDCNAPAQVSFSLHEVKVIVPCKAYSRLVVEYWAGPKAARPFRSFPLEADLKPIPLARDRFANTSNSLIVKVYGLPQSIHGERTFLGEFQE